MFLALFLLAVADVLMREARRGRGPPWLVFELVRHQFTSSHQATLGNNTVTVTQQALAQPNMSSGEDNERCADRSRLQREDTNEHVDETSCDLPRI